MLSQRRVIAGASASYLGITAAALLVGIELGIQPHLWSTNGVPDYSPTASPPPSRRCSYRHMVGASFVEAAITALGVAYLQKSFPEILSAGQRADEQDAAGRARLNPWIPAGAFVGALRRCVVFIAGSDQGRR